MVGRRNVPCGSGVESRLTYRAGMVEMRSVRYRDAEVTYAGVAGVDLEIPSRNPVNFHQAMNAIDAAPPVTIDAKLFTPDDASGDAVMVVPGSLGVGPNHEQHAETLVGEGYVVCVVDPFGARAVASTVSNQTQYSFAASAYDVLATLAVLADRPEVAADRISSQGHSRGGAAVTIASNERFASATLGANGPRLAGAYAVYPWCGQQFADPAIGKTRLRAIIGDLDEWCSVQEVQAQVHAIQLAGGDASIRLVPGAHHSFDRLEPVTLIEEAAVSPGAPTIMIADDGSMVDPTTGESDAALTDGDIFRAANRRGLGRRGARLGGEGDQPTIFRDDMLAFHGSLRG